jgi:predicted RNase H-like nuclease (RuvC/YqgF family)
LIERTWWTERIAKIQNDADTERTSLKQREQNLASRNQELEKEIADERQRREKLTAELEQLRRQQQSTLLAAPSFLLTTAITRKDNSPSPPTIPLSIGAVRLLIKLDGDDYANYQLRLQTAEGQEILRRHTGKIRSGKDRAFVTLTVPSGKLKRGDYVLILFGQTAGGRSEEIDRYFFQVS